MQTPKTSKVGSLEIPQRTSATPRAARQLKTSPSESDTSSSTHPAARTDRSPKVAERRSPRSPVSEILMGAKTVEEVEARVVDGTCVSAQVFACGSKQGRDNLSLKMRKGSRSLRQLDVVRREVGSLILLKRRPARAAEYESQIAHLKDDLKKAKDQVALGESCQKKAQQEADEAKMQVTAMTARLGDTQRQLLELSASEEARVLELQRLSQERDRAWQSELEAVQNQHAIDSTALASAMNEIQRLKLQLELVSDAETSLAKHAEDARAEFQALKLDMEVKLALVKDLETQLRECKESEGHAQAMANEALLDFEKAKATIEMLSSDGLQAMESLGSVTAQLEESKAQVKSLQEVASKLQADLVQAHSRATVDEHDELPQSNIESRKMEVEIDSFKMEVEQLKSALEMSEVKYQQEQIQSTMQIQSAIQSLGSVTAQLEESKAQVKSLQEVASKQQADRVQAHSRATVDELDELPQSNIESRKMEVEIDSVKMEVEQLKSALEMSEVKYQQEQIQSTMQIQSAYEAVESMKLESSQREAELVEKLEKSKADVAELKANLMDKETELQSISEENEGLKLDMEKRELQSSQGNTASSEAMAEAVAEAEAAKAREKEALVKLGCVSVEVEQSSRRAARVAEQLEAAQAANLVMEAELKRIRVQSDQWRKAAEAAAAVLSTANNGKPADTEYHSVTRKIVSPYVDDEDEDSPKKKSNMLKKFGDLWKKGSK